MKKIVLTFKFLFLTAILSFLPNLKAQNESWKYKLTQEEQRIFDTVQYRTFQYFWNGAEPNSGLACERVHMDNVYPENDQHVVTTGGSGFGIMALLVGVYRGWITEEQAMERYIKIIDFLKKADRFHGAWPHWIDGTTGKVKPFGKKDNGGDLVETSFLIQGLLCVQKYYQNKNGIAQFIPNLKGNSPVERRNSPRLDALTEEQKNILRNQNYVIDEIEQFWREIEFDWYTQGKDILYWHWSPNYGWEMNFGVRGYNECLIMYVLAACSPTHPISKRVYDNGWADSGRIVAKNKLPRLYQLGLRHQGNPPNGGPLFWAHYSYLALNPKGLSDRYANYWVENVNQTQLNYRWCVKNPLKYKGYGPNSWGLTASYSVGFYAAHAPDSLNDKGVISPTAAMSSFPYMPKEAAAAMVNWYKNKPQLLGEYGFYDGFSETQNWMDPHYLAIDQGPAIVMMENYRSGLCWNLFMSRSDIQKGLHKLGFKVDPSKK